jgi:hypothetical protein
MPIIEFPEGLSRSQIIRSDIIKLIIANVNIVIEPHHIEERTLAQIQLFDKNKNSGAGIDGDNIREQGIDRRNIAKNTVASLCANNSNTQNISTLQNPQFNNPFIELKKGEPSMGHQGVSSGLASWYRTGTPHNPNTGLPSYIASSNSFFQVPSNAIFSGKVQASAFVHEDASYNYGVSNILHLANGFQPEITVDPDFVEDGDTIVVYCSFNFMAYTLDNNPPLTRDHDGPHFVQAHIFRRSQASPNDTEQILAKRHFTFVGAVNNPIGGYKALPNSSSCTIVVAYDQRSSFNKRQTIGLKLRAFIGSSHNVQPNQVHDSLVRVDSFNMFYKVINGRGE